MMDYRFFDKKAGSASVNKELVQDVRKLVIKKFKRRKGYVRFNVSNWNADLAEMGSLPFFFSKNQQLRKMTYNSALTVIFCVLTGKTKNGKYKL